MKKVFWGIFLILIFIGVIVFLLQSGNWLYVVIIFGVAIMLSAFSIVAVKNDKKNDKHKNYDAFPKFDYKTGNYERVNYDMIENQSSKNTINNTGIKKKKIQDLVNVLNFEMENKYYENISHKLSLFFKNERLSKICYNFISKNKGIYIIDYLVNVHDTISMKDKPKVLLNKNSYCANHNENPDFSNIVKLSNYAFEKDFDRWEDIQNYKSDCLYDLFNNSEDTDEDEEDEKYFKELLQEYKEDDEYNLLPILEFINLLIVSGEIKNEFVDMQALLIFVWLQNKVYLDNTLKKVFEDYDLVQESTVEEIVRKMYQLNNNEKEIINVIASKVYLEKFEKPLLICFEQWKPKVKSLIKKIKNENALFEFENSGEHTSLVEIDLMNGYEFENFIAKLFNKMGYEAEVTKSSGDQGIDVVARKNGYVVAIQAKCYSGVVGNYAVQEAVSGMRYYKAAKCMVITNSTFTKSARELAEVNDVELWDRKVLKEKLKYIGI